MTAYEKLIENGKRRDRRWRAHMEALRANVARLDPRTNGDLGLAHNWGNDAARDAIRHAEKRWRAFADKSDAIAARLMRDHVKGL